jgi:hypothetical protein
MANRVPAPAGAVFGYLDPKKCVDSPIRPRETFFESPSSLATAKEAGPFKRVLHRPASQHHAVRVGRLDWSIGPKGGRLMTEVKTARDVKPDWRRIW